MKNFPRVFLLSEIYTIILDSSRRNKNILSKDRLLLWLNLYMINIIISLIMRFLKKIEAVIEDHNKSYC